jgi:hypothetical protein
VKRYAYLKNGAMYSVFVLGVIMLLHAFHFHIPEWVSPVATFAVIGYFFLKSIWSPPPPQPGLVPHGSADGGAGHAPARETETLGPG